MTLALLFPGQGSQAVGMGAELAKASRHARDTFDEVDEALGQNLAKLMREAGFRAHEPRALADGAFGPPAPRLWSWRPPRKDQLPRDAAAAAGRHGTGRRRPAKLPRLPGRTTPLRPA